LFIDQRYPQSAVLSFQPDPQLDRFWEVPPEPERRPYFVASMLDLWAIGIRAMSGDTLAVGQEALMLSNQ
jgi:hypothetical protein